LLPRVLWPLMILADTDALPSIVQAYNDADLRPTSAVSIS
jgi:hypothetical protein